jgi:transcriptional regulator with XRE-family HTH domain
MAQKKTLSEEFATFLKEKRMRLGMTQAQLSELIYDDPKRAEYIGRIENGKREISVSTMGLMLEKMNAWVEFIE